MASAKQILGYERELKDAGITDKQSEIHARRLADIIESTLVTNEHFDSKLKESENILRDEIIEVKTKLKVGILEVKNKIIELRAEMYRFFIGAMFSMVAMSGVMQTIFHYWK